MLTSRRETLRLALTALPLLSTSLRSFAAAKPVDAHPPLYWVEHLGAKVWIFGEADTRDQSWLTSYVESAFRASSDVWFEAPHPDPRDKKTAAEKQAADEEEERLTHDYGHSVFDAMGPELSARALSAADRYGVTREQLEHTRLWYSYFVINRGYWAFRTKRGWGGAAEAPDRILGKRARAERKPIYAELPTEAAVTHFFSDMTDLQQRQRVSFLLDYFDDEAAGLHQDQYDWLIPGKSPSTRNIDRMRLSYPELYEVEQVKRNIWWAEKVVEMLHGGGTYFICHGLNHLLGPDSMLVRLRERGFEIHSI